MKLTDLARRPTLIKMVLDDEETIKEFGEQLEFWTWDRQPIDQFLKFAQSMNRDENQMMEIVRSLVLDEQGNRAIPDDHTLPGVVLLKVVTRVVENLGK